MDGDDGPKPDGGHAGTDESGPESDEPDALTDGTEFGADRSTAADDEPPIGVALVSIGAGRTGTKRGNGRDAEANDERNAATNDERNAATNDERTEAADDERDAETGGQTDVLAALETSIEPVAHELAIRERIAGDFDTVQATVSRLTDRDDVDVVLTAGGVGIGPDDATNRAVDQLFDAELRAFETLFTTRVADRFGTDVLSVCPTAGVVAGVPIFCLPGDEETASFAMSELVAPQLPRVVSLASPPADDPDDDAEHT